MNSAMLVASHLLQNGRMRAILAVAACLCAFLLAMPVELAFADDVAADEAATAAEQTHQEQSASVPTSDHEGWLLTDKGLWYYFDTSGDVPATGWLYYDGAWYWLDPASGIMATGWVDAGGVWYLMGPDGAMLSDGWIEVGGSWYYLHADGDRAIGWLYYDGAWYWLDYVSGIMAADELLNIDGTLYAFWSSGVMKTDIVVDLGNNRVGYADSWGGITQVGMFEDGKVILRDSEGHPLTGWQYLGGDWFYGEADGVAHTGWLDQDGTWYWMDANGAMATGARNIDGKTYFFDSSGVWIPVSEEHVAVYGRALQELSYCTYPEMTPYEKLWAAFVHIRDDFSEYSMRIPHYHGYGWENLYADDIFVRRGGNCFSCAAAMAFMAKAIGYENVYVCNNGTHGWAEIDGYIFDPEQARWHSGVYFGRSYDTGGGKDYAGSIAAGYDWMRVPL